MSGAKAWTLPEIHEVVSGHTHLLDIAVQEVEYKGDDEEALRRLRAACVNASNRFWAIENYSAHFRGTPADKPWEELSGALWGLPLIALGLESVLAGVETPIRAGEGWVWCSAEGERIVGVLKEWVRRHQTLVSEVLLDVDRET